MTLPANLDVVIDEEGHLTKRIRAYGQPMLLACDGKCCKAWGINNRPKEQLSELVDDYAWLSDDELGIAPENPGTYEGGHGKPVLYEDRLNKWCFRECERSSSGVVNKSPLPDFSKRFHNFAYRNIEGE